MTKKEILTKLNPIIDKSLKVVSESSEKTLMEKIVMLTNQAGKGDADAILEIAILGILIENK